MREALLGVTVIVSSALYVWPVFKVTDFGSKAIDVVATALSTVTLIVSVAVLEFLVAVTVIVVLPGPFPSTKPLLFTVATLVLPELYVIVPL